MSTHTCVHACMYVCVCVQYIPNLHVGGAHVCPHECNARTQTEGAFREGITSVVLDMKIEPDAHMYTHAHAYIHTHIHTFWAS
jgi:hypothetical protein